MSRQSVNVGLQLFPPPPKKVKPSRNKATRPDAMSPQSPPQSALERSESPAFPSDGRQSALDGRQSALGGRQTPQTGRASPITVPSPVLRSAADAPRSHTSFSEAPTLVRSNSNSSHNSIAKIGASTSPQRVEPMIRSIFPRYNPEILLEHQPYYPTQTSPTHIPKAVINRRPYSPSVNRRSASSLQSPMAVGASAGRFPQHVQEETFLEASSTEEMIELWKVTNGWRVSSSEGRTFCFKMTSKAEEPVYTLSSSTQPFYTLRLDPTSTSAQMSMTRLDPNKTASPKLGSSKSNTGMEVLATRIEETTRRLPPNDGLVALLYPRAASNMVIDAQSSNRADEASIIATAEKECGRLVWDEDSKKFYLVHPATGTPFVISIHTSPAWSRVEYTLEHETLPRNLVRLVRDTTGSGFLEIDTGVAAKIDCFYIVDVAICAVLLVAIEDEKARKVERFDAPPPSIAPTSPTTLTGKEKGKRKEKSKSKSKNKKEKYVNVEEFEMDLESQDSVTDRKEKDKEEKIPGFLGLIWMLIKFFIWTLKMFVKAIAGIIIFLSKCLTRKSLS